MASAALCKIGAWNSVLDTFVAHASSPTGAVIDLNDGVTWSLRDDKLDGSGLDLGNVPPAVLMSGNHRVPGERIPRKNYSTNRHIKASLVMGPTTTYTAFTTALHNLEQLCQGVTQDAPAALQLQASPSSTPVYADVLECHVITNYYELEWIQLVNLHVEIEFICKPFFRGARQWLQNLVWNPGFEAPSGPGVNAFNDPFNNTNAYTIQAGGPLGTDTSTYADAAQTLHPLRYYRLDEPSGTTVFDVMHNGDGTIVAGITQGVAGALNTDTDTAITANGTTGTITLPTSGLPSGNGPWSISAWAKFAANPASTQYIMSFGSAATKSDVLLAITSAGKAQVDTDSGPQCTSTSALSTGAYHHLVGTWDGSNILLYVDAVSTGTPSGSGPLTVGSTYARISGWQTSLTGPFAGQIDEVLIFNYALSSGNVTTLYNAGHNAPTSNSNSITLPASCRIKFGSPAWQALNQWQVRFRYATSGVFTCYLHYTDASNNLFAQYNTGAGGTLGLFHNVGGVLNTLATVTAVHATPGAKYWITASQFPSLTTTAPQVTVALAPDSNGAPGVTQATVGPVATSSAFAAIAGQPQILAGGATIGVDKNTLTLFGPGGWYWFGNSGTSATSAAWEGTGLGGMSGTGGNSYAGGPVTSYGCGRIDGPPAGTWTASWRSGDSTSLTTLLQTAIPVQTPGDVLGGSVWVKNNTSSGTAAMSFNFVEYDATGALLRTGSNVASVSGAQASYTQLSGNYTTGANCALCVMICAASDSTANSANKQFWFDNAQCWDQAVTGAATMAWHDLRGPQSPYQAVVSGIAGDIKVPIVAQVGLYAGTWNAGRNFAMQFGVSAIFNAATQLVIPGYAPASNGTLSLDTTAYGGFVNSLTGAGGNPITAPTAFLSWYANGQYHAYSRMKITGAATPTAVQVNLANFLVGPSSTFNYTLVTPFAANSTWYNADLGLVRPVVGNPSILADLTAAPGGQMQLSTVGDSSSKTTISNYIALCPVDGSIALVAINNPTGAYSGWLHLYLDSLSLSSNFTVDTYALPNGVAATFGPGGGSGATTQPLADSQLSLDPSLRTSSGVGVNQMLLAGQDSTGAINSVTLDIVYSPLYLQLT